MFHNIILRDNIRLVILPLESIVDVISPNVMVEISVVVSSKLVVVISALSSLVVGIEVIITVDPDVS